MQIEPRKRVERSYTGQQKIEVLNWMKYHRVPNEASNTGVRMRCPTLDEASMFFIIPKSTIGRWRKTAKKILEQVGGESSRRDAPITFLCLWPEMERQLFDRFVARRSQGRPVRDGWFRRNAKELWRTSYPELPEGLFVFSQGWFHGFLSRFRVVLRFVTNTAQSLPANYKDQILIWLRFNHRNRILTPFVPRAVSIISTSPPIVNPLALHYICNDDQGGIPEHRICNVDETPLPWEYLIGRTYDIQGAKTVWSKSAELGSEKRQCTLFLCIFADGVPRVPSILIFTAASGTRIRERESHQWDKRVDVEFSPTGWMNETLFTKFILKYLVPLFGKQRALFIFDRFRAHLTPQVLQTCQDHSITPSLNPAGTTPLTQPLDVAMNKPFKGLIKEFTEELREKKETDEDMEKWSVSQHRVVTTETVGKAWEEWHKPGSQSRQKIVIQSFLDTGISLPVDGSCDHELNIKDFALGELVVGDWVHSEEEMGYEVTETENSELLPTDTGNNTVEFRLLDE